MWYGIGHVVTKTFHIAYKSMCHDETNNLGPNARLYLNSINSYENRARHSGNNYTRVIKRELKEYFKDLFLTLNLNIFEKWDEVIHMFLERKPFEYFSIAL